MVRGCTANTSAGTGRTRGTVLDQPLPNRLPVSARTADDYAPAAAHPPRTPHRAALARRPGGWRTGTATPPAPRSRCAPANPSAGTGGTRSIALAPGKDCATHTRPPPRSRCAPARADARAYGQVPRQKGADREWRVPVRHPRFVPLTPCSFCIPSLAEGGIIEPAGERRGERFGHWRRRWTSRRGHPDPGRGGREHRSYCLFRSS